MTGRDPSDAGDFDPEIECCGSGLAGISLSPIRHPDPVTELGAVVLHIESKPDRTDQQRLRINQVDRERISSAVGEFGGLFLDPLLGVIECVGMRDSAGVSGDLAVGGQKCDARRIVRDKRSQVQA